MSKTASASKSLSSAETLRGSTGSVLSLVEELTSRLQAAGLPSAGRTASDVVSALMEVSRSWPAVNPSASVSDDIATHARIAAARLISGAPFAYAVGSAQFRHLNLHVDERVLIPRPETEILIDEVIAMMKRRFDDSDTWGTAVDIGTGSGAIALSLAAEGKFERVIATDVSRDAIKVAEANARKSGAVLKCDVEFRHGSLLAPVGDVRAPALVSNPPYIAFSEIDALPASVRDWEPPLALLSGNNGMWAIAQIISQGAPILVSGGILALEVDERRASLATEIVIAHGQYAEVSVRLDLAGRERFVLASKI